MRKIARIIVLLSPVLLAVVMLSQPTPASAQIRITVGFAPPALPVYEQPICPGDGYLWTPGYWAWDPDFDDYYWVPGTWVLAPEVGYLWTPPWWGWDGGVFLFHEGWWGPHIGFYGGVNYGFGYFGVGFVGGRWDGGHFFYNREVTNINVVNIHNVYNEHVNVTVNHVSYNGGNGGIMARPRPEEERAMQERHIGAVAVQTEHIRQAQGNRDLRASVNQGRPSIGATGRAGDFSGARPAREAGAPYHAPDRGGNAGGGNNGGNWTHAKELPPLERQQAPNTGNAAQDRRIQQQQDKLYDKQNQERQKLQQQQEKEDQRMQRQNANEQQRQQTEQRHQQQTQEMQQRHEQQRQQAAPQPHQSGGGNERHK